jgi:DNA-binding SARP family transcriptional activator
MTVSISIRLFGYPTVTVNDEPLQLPRRKAMGLLVLLVVEAQARSRDYLCSLLWHDEEPQRARAELRRALATLNKTPLSDHILANRDSIQLQNIEDWDVDVWWLHAEQDMSLLSDDVLASCTATFLEGFTLDIVAFEEWTRQMAGQLQQRLLREIIIRYERNIFEAKYDDAQYALELWLQVDPCDETAHRHLLRIHGAAGRYEHALSLHNNFVEQLRQELDMAPGEETEQLVKKLESRALIDVSQVGINVGTLPPLPALFIGRQDVLETLRQRLGVDDDSPETDVQRVILQGWPGIGKTTLTSILCHDFSVQRHFADGIFWTSLGQKPDVVAQLERWAAALGLNVPQKMRNTDDLSRLLSDALRNKRILVIVDDIWDERFAPAFQVTGRQGVMLFTTRLNRVAQSLAPHADSIYKVPILPDTEALHLLRTLAPQAVDAHTDAALGLIHDLEGLPLALQVAGRMLHAEMTLGWGVEELLAELRKDSSILEAQAPADRQSIDDEVPLTVSALLRRSTDSLDEMTRQRFALLGVFAPKPATFELPAIQAVWDTEQTRDTVRRLVERGLLEANDGSFQMHALLVKHARSMFTH